ncbi:kelch-like protein 7 [Oculina patagonica]
MESLTQQLNEMRENDILCDTTIRAHGEDFPAHKCVLSAASQYFRALYTSQMKQTESNVVDLQEAKSPTISDVLQFIYTGKVSIDLSNARDLVVIADFLIIPSLKSKAALILESSVKVSNCLALESFATLYNCEALKQVAVTCKFENFVAVAKSADFKGLDLERVKELISSDDINVSKEHEVYEAVIDWVKHDLPSRECFLAELLKCVRLSSISEDNLRKILDEELITNNSNCTRMVNNTLDFLLFPDRYQDLPLNPRLSLEEDVVVLTGGVSTKLNQDTQCFVPSTRTWVSLPTMPCCCPLGDAAVCDGLLYMFGEANEEDIENDLEWQSEPKMCCFNPKQNKWTCHDVTKNRHEFSLTCFDNELYMIGGNDIHHTCSGVEIYNPGLNEWRQAASMATGRAGHSTVVLQDHIYVMGGENRNDANICLNSVECYNPLSDQWVNVSNMCKTRMFAAAATVYDKIVVVGGYADFTYSNIEPTCEVFDRTLNEWSLVASPAVPRAACRAVSVNGMVYLFGGLENEELETTEVEEVECFDLRNSNWCKVSNTNRPYAYHQACVLKIPKRYAVTEGQQPDASLPPSAYPRTCCQIL